jgi:hypothetical protein
MKTILKSTYSAFILSALLIAGASSCKKEVSTGSDTTTNTVATTSTSATIAVAVAGTTTTTTAGTTTTDSVYIMQTCDRGTHRDSIAAANLLATIQTYLTTNYSGYSFIKAYALKDSTGSVKGYVVIINYNGKPVGLQFDANGNFVRVLEQREKPDLNNGGWHLGGIFENRDGLRKDTVALTALPSAITTYYTTNYSTDTLLKAFKTHDGGYLVISKDNGLYASVFTSTGVFVKRTALPTQEGPFTVVAQSTLSSTILNYLSTTYPNYVFDVAASISFNSVNLGYVVVVNANNTTYAVLFNSSGTFVAAKVIW